MEKNIIKNNSAGFTLVELLVVVALLGISVGITNDILTSLVRSYSKTQVKNEIEQQANFLGLKLEREIRSAVRIQETGSTNTLTIERGDSTVIYTYDSVNLVLNVTYEDNPVGPFPITTTTGVGGLRATCPSFGGNCFSVVGTTPQVVSMHIRFEPVLGSSSSTFAGSAEISNTITVRSTQ